MSDLNPPIPPDAPQLRPTELYPEPLVSPEHEQRVTLEHQATSDGFDPAAPALDLPVRLGGTDHPTFKDIDNSDPTASGPGEAWTASVGKGNLLLQFQNVYTNRLKDPAADFGQTVNYNGFSICMSESGLRNTGSRPKVDGEAFASLLSTHLGLGSQQIVPLPHSGFYVWVKPPAETAWIELYRLLFAETVRFGYRTHALAFSNMSAFTVELLKNFIFQHIWRTSIRWTSDSYEDLKDYIKAQDYPLLLLGILAARYPRGYQYRQACGANPGTCNHISTGKLSLPKCLVIDRNALSESHKAHMARRDKGVHSIEEVLTYQKTLLALQKHKVTLKGETGATLTLTFASPSLGEYIRSGHAWIDRLISDAERALDTESSIQDRNAYIQSLSQATFMRQFMHFVEAIEFDDQVANDQKTLEVCLDTINLDDKLRAAFLDEVVAFIERSTIAIAGVRSYTCPECLGGKPETDPQVLGQSEFIPLDVMQTFFILLTQLLNRLIER